MQLCQVFLIYLKMHYYVHPCYTVFNHTGEFRFFLKLYCYYFSLKYILYDISTSTIFKLFLPWCIFSNILFSIFLWFLYLFFIKLYNYIFKQLILEYLSFNWQYRLFIWIISSILSSAFYLPWLFLFSLTFFHCILSPTPLLFWKLHTYSLFFFQKHSPAKK